MPDHPHLRESLHFGQPRLRGHDGAGPPAADLTADTFDGIIRANRTAALTAYYYSQYDAEGLWQTIDRVRDDRGTMFHRYCVLNDLNDAAVEAQAGRVGCPAIPPPREW